MCYLIAKKFNDHGCIALKTSFGEDLKYLIETIVNNSYINREI